MFGALPRAYCLGDIGLARSELGRASTDHRLRTRQYADCERAKPQQRREVQFASCTNEGSPALLALVEIRRRKLQFALVTGVVTLIAYLIIMVTDLGLGLSQRAGTALLSLDGDYLAYASNANLSVIRSRFTDAEVAEIESAPGVERATPIGYVASVVEYGLDRSDTVAVLGVVPGSFAGPVVVEGASIGGMDDVLIDGAWARSAGTEIGDELPLPVGFETREFTVVGIADQGFFFFQPAIYIDLSAWQDLVYQGTRPSALRQAPCCCKGRTSRGAVASGGRS